MWKAYFNTVSLSFTAIFITKILLISLCAIWVGTAVFLLENIAILVRSDTTRKLQCE